MWQLDPNRRQWLRAHPDRADKACCIICNKVFNAHLRTINDHARSAAHIRRLENVDPEANEFHEDEDQIRKEINRIKIILCMFFAKHRLPFALIDELLPLIVNVSQNANALREVKMKRNLMQKITNDVIATSYKAELINLLRTYKFSILFDESTDVSTKKHGCIIVRFFNVHLNKVITALWAIVPIYNDDDEVSEATANGLYNRIIESFGNFVIIPGGNVQAFVSDGCSVMVGVANSVAQKFRRDFPGIHTISCPCHAAHLCASYAIKELPQRIIDLPRDVYNFFKSPKRKHLLSQEQINANYDVHQILRPVPTRWLEMGPCVNRILNQWVPISNVLDRMSHDNDVARRLCNIFDNTTTKCYLMFLNYILPMMENLNGWLQGEQVLIHIVYHRIEATYLDILKHFLQNEYVDNTDVNDINLDDETNYKDLNELEVDDTVMNVVLNLDEEEWNTLMINFRNYFVCLARHLRHRLLMPWYQYRILNCLLPSNPLSNDSY